jgi:tetratricopeptide (TPR) repeat protein
VIKGGAENTIAVARRALEEAPTAADRARALTALASALRSGGHALDGAETAGRAVSAFHERDDELAAARSQRLAADCLADAERHEDALGLLKRARRVFVAHDVTGPDAAGTEVAAARSLRALGHASASSQALHRAERAFTAAGMPVRAAVCRLDRAVLLHDDGDVADAIALLVEAHRTFTTHRRPDLAAVGDFDLGVALLDDGQAEDAIERFVRARGIFSSLDRRADEAACDLNMGVALHALGRTDEARHALRRARTAFRDLGRDRDAEQAEHDLDVLDGLVDPDTAELSVLRVLGEVPGDVKDLAARLDEETVDVSDSGPPPPPSRPRD